MTARQTGPPTPSPDPPPAGPGSEADRLADALAGEHAAIFAYGPVGAWLDDDDLAEAAREAEQVHRDRRDELVRMLTERNAPPPAAEPSYELPFEVGDADAAIRLAALVEARVAGAWRAVLPETSGTTRAAALDALVDAAVRATAWRTAAGETPATVPFPGAG